MHYKLHTNFQGLIFKIVIEGAKLKKLKIQCEWFIAGMQEKDNDAPEKLGKYFTTEAWQASNLE